MTTLYVGNLPYRFSGSDLRSMFAPYGLLCRVEIVRDRWSGRSKGYGYVDMQPDDAARAVASLNGREVNGRRLRIDYERGRPR